jgi:very-short-patch-repair endonuclease
MPRKLFPDETALRKVLKRQEAVISRSQALMLGLTDAAIRRRTGPGGSWQRLLPGVYLTVTGRATLDQRQIAALLYAGHSSMLTGTAALHRLEVRVPARDTMVVLVPADKQHRSVGYVTIWPTTRMPERCMVAGVIRFAMPDRAAADATRELTSDRDIRAVIADAVQKRWCAPERLAEELRLGPRRGSRPLRMALAEVADGARSVAESDLLRLIKRACIDAPLCNRLVYAGKTFIAKPDMWWPDAGVAVEVDSREWHLLPEHAEETMRRHNRMGMHGIVVLHFAPRQIREQPDWVISEIRRALSSGRTRPPLPLRTVEAA